jgi:protocatechuate 3,4-dioxygenase alpha subunit
MAAASSKMGATPGQTVGPFFKIGFTPLTDIVPAGSPGAIRVTGRVLDGAGEPLGDAVVEIWQADAAGVYHHPEDPRWIGETDGFGFGRALTDSDGGFAFTTVKPGCAPSPEGGVQAPHLAVSVLARGLLHRLATRCYFGDEAAANAADDVLRAVPDEQRASLVAPVDGAASYRFDIHLQGPHATAFFAI